MPRSSERYLPFRLPNQSFVHISPTFHASYMPRPAKEVRKPGRKISRTRFVGGYTAVYTRFLIPLIQQYIQQVLFPNYFNGIQR
jgi:hypothetical protein